MSTSRVSARVLRRALAGRVPFSATGNSFHGLENLRLAPQQQQHTRSMVVVTKTSSVDPPPVKQPNNNNNNGSTVSQSPPSTDNIDTDAEQTTELLTITPSCVKQVHTLLERRNKTPEEMFLRVFVDAGGCSGFTYKFELDDEYFEDEDLVFEPPDANGARVVVDEASLKLIQGSKIDYVQEMIKSAFVVSDNPQSESACGCGSSFAVKNFAANPALD